MLAHLGRAAFDSDEHLFEVKWDGTRALSFTEHDEHRLRDRRGAEMRERFPELAFLAALEPGLVLDGEIVVLAGDRPDFGATMGRVHARGARRRRRASRRPTSSSTCSTAATRRASSARCASAGRSSRSSSSARPHHAWSSRRA
jgi:hypothetical protein